MAQVLRQMGLYPQLRLLYTLHLLSRCCCLFWLYTKKNTLPCSVASPCHHFCTVGSTRCPYVVEYTFVVLRSPLLANICHVAFSGMYFIPVLSSRDIDNMSLLSMVWTVIVTVVTCEISYFPYDSLVYEAPHLFLHIHYYYCR